MKKIFFSLGLAVAALVGCSSLMSGGEQAQLAKCNHYLDQIPQDAHSAQACFTAIYNKDPRSMDALVGIARSSSGPQAFDKANDVLKFPGVTVAQKAKAYNVIGRYYQNLMPPDNNEAIKNYNLAKSLDPLFDKPYGNLVNIYLGDKKDNMALAVLQEELNAAKKANDAHALSAAYVGFSRFYEFKKKYDQALENAQLATSFFPGNSLAWYNVGTYHLDLGSYPQAIQALEKAVALNPKYVDAYANLSLAYLKMGNYEGAIQALLQAKKLDPDQVSNQEYYDMELGYIYYDQSKDPKYANQAARLQKIAKKYLDQAVVSDKDNQDDSLAEYRCLDKGDSSVCQRALGFYQENPDGQIPLNKQAQLTQCTSYIDTFPQDLKTGLACLNLTYKVRLNSVDTLVDMARSSQGKQVLDYAHQVLLAPTSTPQQKAAAYNSIGKYYQNLGPSYQKESIKNYQLAQRLDPSLARTYSNLLEIYIADKETYALGFQEAQKEISTAKRLKDNQLLSNGYIDLGFAYEKAKNYEQALKNYQMGLALVQDSLNFYDVGTAHLELGQYPEAIKNLEKALELNPKNYYASENISQSYLNLGDYDQAISWINKMHDQSQDDEAYNQMLGYIYYAKAQDPKWASEKEVSQKLAKEYLDKAVALDKNHSDHYLQQYRCVDLHDRSACQGALDFYESQPARLLEINKEETVKQLKAILASES